MTIEEKLIKIAENAAKAGGGDITKNPLYYAKIKAFQWAHVAFSEGFDLVMNVRDKPEDMNALLTGTTGIKTVTLICEAEGTVSYAQLIRESTAEILDITDFKPIPTSIAYFVYNSKSIVSILGELDLSSCTVATSAFANATALKAIGFKERTISISLDFHYCKNLSAESIYSIFMGCALEGSFTITFPPYETIKSVYDAVYGEGQFDAQVAFLSNVTFAYS